jgi:predicted RNase H-like nuclease (RuvC/YqgF family)
MDQYKQDESAERVVAPVKPVVDTALKSAMQKIDILEEKLVEQQKTIEKLQKEFLRLRNNLNTVATGVRRER